MSIATPDSSLLMCDVKENLLESRTRKPLSIKLARGFLAGIDTRIQREPDYLQNRQQDRLQICTKTP